MSVGERLRAVWRRAGGLALAGKGADLDAGADLVRRRTLALPSTSKPRAGVERRDSQADAGEFAAVCGDAGGAAGDQCNQGSHCCHGLAGAGAAWLRASETHALGSRLSALRWMLEEPNSTDSFRTLMEQVIEDALTGGYGAIEMEATGDPELPAQLWPVDGATIRVNADWDGGDPETARYSQAPVGSMPSQAVDLRRRPVDVCADEST